MQEECHFCGFLWRICPDTPDQQPVGVYAVGRAGEQRTQVLTCDDLYIVDLIGTHDLDLIHLIGECAVQHDQLECVAELHFVQLGKQLGVGETAVGRQYAVRVAAADRESGAGQMAAGNVEHLSGNAVVNRQFHAELGDVDITHYAVAVYVQNFFVALKLRVVHQRGG